MEVVLYKHSTSTLLEVSTVNVKLDTLDQTAQVDTTEHIRCHELKLRSGDRLSVVVYGCRLSRVKSAVDTDFHTHAHARARACVCVCACD